MVDCNASDAIFLHLYPKTNTDTRSWIFTNFSFNIENQEEYMDMQGRTHQPFGDIPKPVENLLLIAQIKSDGPSGRRDGG